MNPSRIFIGVLFSLLLFGCSQAAQLPTPGEKSPPQTTTKVPKAETSKPLNPEEADALMTATIQAINQKNTAFFIPYLLERDRNSENVEVALNHYETYFQGEKIADFERLTIEQLGETGDKTPIQRFNYRISSPSGISKEIAVYQDNTIRLNDPFLFYSFYAERLVARYVSAIQSQDVEKISQVFNGEEQVFRQDELKAVLAQYKESLSLDRLNYRLTGLNSEQQHFIYTLSGNKGSEHSIQVLYGDGLVGIRDRFLPAKN